MIDARHEQRLPVPRSGEVHRVGQNSDAHSNDCIQGPVKHEQVRVRVPDVVHRDAEENDAGKVGGFPDTNDDCRIQDDADEQHKNQVIHERIVKIHLSPGQPQSAEHDHSAPESADQRAGDPVFAHFEHVCRIRLNTLQGRDDRVERRTVSAAQVIDRNAQKRREYRPHDPLAGNGYLFHICLLIPFFVKPFRIIMALRHSSSFPFHYTPVYSVKTKENAIGTHTDGSSPGAAQNRFLTSL